MFFNPAERANAMHSVAEYASLLNITAKGLNKRITRYSNTTPNDIIKNRISVYNNETLPVADFYKSQNKLASIYGIGEVEEIYNNICAALSKVTVA